MWQEESEESSASSAENNDDEKLTEAAADEPDSGQNSVTRDGAVDDPTESTESNENDSEYEESEKEDNNSEDGQDDEDEKESSSAASSSASPSPPPKRGGNSRKMDDKTRELLEDNNFLRRSSRSKPTESSGGSRRRKKESDSDDDDSSSSEDEQPRRRKTAETKRKKGAKEAARTVVRKEAKKGVDYTEKDTDEDVNDDDVLEWEEEKPAASSSQPVPVAESIERVMRIRLGVAGATGSATTCYNVAEKGDPNRLAAEATAVREKQYLIKWVGWSHLHNTWESEQSIVLMGANGLKRIHNFNKKLREIDEWRSTADKEYIEFFDCEQVMGEELCEQYMKVERIVAHQVSRDKTSDGSQATEYYVKWHGLSYADCTWEDERLLPRDHLDEYHTRIDNFKSPNKNAAVLRRRPKFVKMDKMPSFLQPADREKQDLRDYQLEGLNWMLHAWCKGNSCILADEMGLGKTIQSISFLSALFHRHELHGPFLVVVPLSTMAAWQKEFNQWAPSLNLVTYMGDGPSREQIRQFEWYLPGGKKLKVNAVLTTYEILLKDKSFLGSFSWAALAVDEAHRLKNDESLLYKCLLQFSCDHRLLITGTPLQNSLKELWALLHFIMPMKFESWEQFEADHNDKDHKGISALHKKLEPYLLRRVKKDVEKSLPPKLEQILRVDMTAQQKQYYKWILTKNYRELSKGVKGSINGFVNLVMELKKCCNHTSLVRQYDMFENEAHARLQQLLKSSGKLILLDKLLCRLKETGHRVLIFSQMVMMLDILQEYLQLRRFPAQRLDGSMRADLRKQALDHFNADGSSDFCFLLSTRAGGLGINLATADTVIIFDSDWNPQNDLQAMSRAHRIGQTRQVNIYRLVTRGSVEEEIVERAKRKLVLDHLVIQRMDTSGRTVLSKAAANGSVPFGKHELNDILKFGAAELFKEKEGEEQEPEVDIDRILMGAETREAEETQENSNDLLSSFKYANFVFDEEKDVAAAAQQKGRSDEGAETAENEWDSIIPEDEREKIQEQERLKAAASLELAPRQRTKMVEGAEEEGDGGSSDDDSEAEGGSGKKRKRKAWGEFSAAEVKKFVRAFRKFAKPLERLEAVAQEAELEDHSTAELEKLSEALLEGCRKAEEEHLAKKQEEEKDKKDGEKSKDRGASFRFAGVVEVNVRQMSKMQLELAPLHEAVQSTSLEDFKAPHNARPQKGWDVEWSSVDDAALLKGVYKYGMGSWESIKMDPQLGLADKMFLKDKVKKPQRIHVQQRVDYLLKLFHSKAAENGGGRTRKAAVPAKRRKMTEEKTRNVPDKKKKDSKDASPREKSFADQLSLLSIDKGLYAAALEKTGDRPFTDCVKMMRPVQKYIKRLADAENQKESSKYLARLGDNCRDRLEELVAKKPKTNVRKWYNYMWIFLSKFVPQEPAELVEKYRNLQSTISHHNHKHRAHHKEKEKEEKPKDKKEKDKKEKHRKDHHKNHEKDRRSSNDHKLRSPLKESVRAPSPAKL